jgi:hypothetical protein
VPFDRHRQWHGRVDRRADHDGRTDVFEVTAGEMPAPERLRGLGQRTPLVEQSRRFPDVEQPAERVALDRLRHRHARREGKRVHRTLDPGTCWCAVAQAQGCAQLPNLVDEACRCRVGFGLLPPSGLRLGLDKSGQCLAHDLGHDQPDRLCIQLSNRALRHDPRLDPLHCGEESGCPPHRLGQDLRAERGGYESWRPVATIFCCTRRRNYQVPLRHQR